MDRILLGVKRKKERHKLEDWLSPRYQIILPPADGSLEGEYDMALLDGASLRQSRPAVRARRNAEKPLLLPFLLVTVRRRGSLPSRHLGRLVDDVILRPIAQKELLARVANLLRMRRWSQELKKEHDRAMKLAVTDDVSGFNNTRYLHRFLDRLIEPNNSSETEVCLVFFDLDDFKRVVDAHGHLLGSKMLREVAQVIHRLLDPDDRLVRYGGDEFIVILPRQSKPEALAKVARMRNAISSWRFLHKEGIDAHLTASFGLAAYPQDAKDKHELLAEADRYLFESKSAGKDRITFGELLEAA